MIGCDHRIKKSVNYLSCIEEKGGLKLICCIQKMTGYLFLYYKIPFNQKAKNINLEIFSVQTKRQNKAPILHLYLNLTLLYKYLFFTKSKKSLTYVCLSEDAYLPLEPQGDLLGWEGEVRGRGGRTPSPPYEFLCFVPRRNLLDDVSTSDITPKNKQKICITSII